MLTHSQPGVQRPVPGTVTYVGCRRAWQALRPRPGLRKGVRHYVFARNWRTSASSCFGLLGFVTCASQPVARSPRELQARTCLQRSLMGSEGPSVGPQTKPLEGMDAVAGPREIGRSCRRRRFFQGLGTRLGFAGHRPHCIAHCLGVCASRSASVRASTRTRPHVLRIGARIKPND
jgi:hypothetical protein